MSEHWLYTGGRSYLVTGDEGGEFDDIVAWMATEHGQPAPVVALSRQQVLTRIARTTLPTGRPVAASIRSASIYSSVFWSR